MDRRNFLRSSLMAGSALALPDAGKLASLSTSAYAARMLRARVAIDSRQPL